MQRVLPLFAVKGFVPPNDTSDHVLLGKIRVEIQAETQVCKKKMLQNKAVQNKALQK